MKKGLIFILVGLIYVCVALGFSWINSCGFLDTGLKFIGLQPNSAMAAEASGPSVSGDPDSGPSNVPIPPPPYPQPKPNPRPDIS
jgi:hypothetical protein